jgi:hypothetical protein
MEESDSIQVPEEERWRYRAAAVDLRLSLGGRPMSPGARLMIQALDDIAAGRAPRSPEPRAQQRRHREPLSRHITQAAVMTAIAIGFAGAGIGCAALGACAAMGVLP